MLSNDVGIGEEVGLAAGYHWRWLDVGIGATYNRDPPRRKGRATCSKSDRRLRLRRVSLGEMCFDG